MKPQRFWTALVERLVHSGAARPTGPQTLILTAPKSPTAEATMQQRAKIFSPRFRFFPARTPNPIRSTSWKNCGPASKNKRALLDKDPYKGGMPGAQAIRNPDESRGPNICPVV